MTRTTTTLLLAAALLTGGAGTALAVDLPGAATSGPGQAPIHVPTTKRAPAPDVAVPADGVLLAGRRLGASPVDVEPIGSAWKRKLPGIPAGSRWAGAPAVTAAGRIWASTGEQSPTIVQVRVKSEV